MRFTGQIRIPDIDHPGVPATFLIEENQAEVVLDGESLGRWSLFDVQARRLVSSAFQVEFEDEEVTFLENIAEQLGAALDSARLYAQTQQQAEQERLIGEVTSQVRRSLDVE